MATKAYPPSICTGIPRLGKCPHGWSTRTFGQVLRLVERPVDIQDNTIYQLVNAKRNRGGIVPRECLNGRDIKTKDQYFVHEGDFLIANRQIIHGACGIVPKELDGALVSGEYTVLHANDGLLLPWFATFTHTPYFQITCFHSSIGVDVEKMVFKLDWWLKHELHVPPMGEQAKIAGILSTWDEAIEQTRALIAAAKRRKKALMQQLLTGKKRLPRFAGRWRRVKMEDVCDINPSNVASEGTCEAKMDSVPFLRMEDVTEDGRIVGYRRIAGCTTSGGFTAFRNDDVLVAKITPCFENGKGCLVKNLPAAIGLGSTEFHTIRSGLEIIPDIVFQITQSRVFRDRGMSYMTGSAGQKRVPAEFLASYSINLPGISEQRAIAVVLTTSDDEIKSLETKCAALERQKKGLMQKLLTGQVRVKP